MGTISKEKLIEDFSKSAEEGNAAFFIGAGISVPYGLPNFQELIIELAKGRLDFEIKSSHDYPQIAQFILNEIGDKKIILEELAYKFRIKYDRKKSTYLDSISKSSISTIWTTNYDTLIEQSLENCGKAYDVKNEDNLFNSLNDLNKIEVLKVHGDINASDMVITKRDYEDFNLNNKITIKRLENDLIFKSVLFVGYSYKDPNIQNIVNSVRQLLEGDFSHKHYMILEKPKNKNEKKIQAFWIKDIQRYGIFVYEYENGDYDELEKILCTISCKSKGKSVFVTGSHFTEENSIAKSLGEALSEINGLVLKYGHSQGIGNIVCNQYVQKCQKQKEKLEERIEIFANPYAFCEEWDNKSALLDYLKVFRERLIKNVQIIIAFSGGKGTILEIEMGLKLGAVIIPVFKSEDNFKKEIMKNEEVIKVLKKYDKGYVKKLVKNSITTEDIIGCVRAVLNE